MKRLACVAIASLASCALASLPAAARPVGTDERVAAQRAIEQVFWNHRIWPADNPGAKPPLAAVMPATALHAKVDDALRKSTALASLYGRPITAAQLQAEIDRMASHTSDPRILKELFDALGDDPYVVAETLARETLADRLLRHAYAADPASSARSFDAWWSDERGSIAAEIPAVSGSFVLPPLNDAPACTADTWSMTRDDVPDPRYGHVAVWTGTEMIVWGGSGGRDTGGRYNPATDTWTATSTGAGVPTARTGSTAVWTGSARIVWGGSDASGVTNTGPAMTRRATRGRRPRPGRTARPPARIRRPCGPEPR